MSYIINSFLNIRVSDVVDIIIVAFLLFKFFNYMSQTRAVNLFKGMIIIFLIWGLAEYFDFTVVKFLIRNLMTLGLIFLLVVFQPELRMGLEKLGRGGKFMSSGILSNQSNLSVDFFDELVSSVKDLSDSKTGALIVIERETPLGDISETGEKINASVSSSLIKNLFFKNSPLHDGALIISDRKIIAAACILPLSNTSNMSKNLGTRHRAAMGIAERTDAFVIVVSEETGTVSVASDGRLARFVDIPGLESLLKSKLYSEKENKGFNTILNSLKKTARGEEHEN